MAKKHTVKSGDFLIYISQRYYGTQGKWKLIANANPQIYGRGVASDGSPLIFPGDVLIIPDDLDNQKKEPETINADSDDQLTVIIDGNQFKFFSEFSLSQPIDSFDTFSLSAPFEPTIMTYRTSFKPFSYKEAKIFYGSNLFMTGIILAPQPNSTPSSRPINIVGYSKPAVISDQTLSISKYPTEFNNQTLQNIVNALISDYGLTASFLSDAGNPFKKVAPEPTQKIIDFFIDLSSQRGLLLTNDEQGNLVFWKENSGTPVASFKEGETPFIECQPNFNPQEFYSHVTGIAPAKSGMASAKYTVTNNYLVQNGITRNYNYNVSDAETGDLQAAVKHKAGLMFANACSYRLTVQGHKDRSKNLYKKNTIISVNAPGSMIYNDFNFLVKNVEFSRTPTGGDITILDLCLPGSFSGTIPTSFPWE